MDPYQTNSATWNALAQAYQDKFMDLDLYNDTYDLFLDQITQPDARVLELGCGPGNVTRYLLSQKPGLQITATDIAPSMLELARTNNPTATLRELDVRQLSQLNGQEFEAILCGFVMPYLTQEDCARLISDSANLLTTGGVLYTSCIEDNYSRSGLQTSASGNRMYIYYHEAGYLQQYLRIAGFRLLHILRKQYPTPSGTDTHLILIAEKE